MPLCDAVIVHVPVVRTVTITPETLHTEVVFDANATVSPELATAPIEKGELPTGTLASVPKVMVWVVGDTVKLTEPLAAW